MKKGKKYQDALKLVDRTKRYTYDEAVELVKKTSYAKFDATVELAMRLNLDQRKAEQNIRGAIVLPHGTGKTTRVVVIAQGAKAEEAKQAGADFVGDDELIQKMSGGWLDFDTVIATPDMMAKLGRIGKVLGPRGLMPNPKTGTVTQDVAKAVQEAKSGKIEYRLDKFGNIQVGIGKVSFENAKLVENAKTLIEQIVRVKPSTVKGAYIKNITLSATQGPGIKLDLDRIVSKLIT